MALPSQVDQRAGSEGRTHTQRRKGLSKGVLIGAGSLMLLGFALLVYALRPKNPEVPPATQLERQNTLDKTGGLPGTQPGGKIGGTLGTPSNTAPAGTPTTEPAPGDSPGALTKALTGPGASPSEAPKPNPVDLSTPSGGNPTVSTPTPNPNPSPAKPTSPTGTIPASAPTEEFRYSMDSGDKKLSSGDLVGARTVFSRLLADVRTSRADQDSLRTKLAKLNDDLIFSSKFVAGDPFVEEYTVQSGDNPTKIARKRDLATEPNLISRINKVDPGKLKVGQKLKLLRGPFHAVVHKGDYRLDLFAGSPDDQTGWAFIRSFRVGLGENNSTPTGTFTVKSSSKLVNPHWVNPRTGEKFNASDPKNPIGERWIGIEGVGAAAVHTGYGLHGTIEPDSIGQQKSMGCVRLASDDIDLLYDLLVEKISVVKIEP